MPVIHHALVLNLHQPHGNLSRLLEEQPDVARQILYAYDRIARFLWAYEDVAKVHLSLSGTLLSTLSNPSFQSSVYGVVDCGSLLWHLQNRQIIDIIGTAFYYPVLPLIPSEDWVEHLDRWTALASHLFWRRDFAGFWPPELGFTMELIPVLSAKGYRYVVVDSEHVKPLTPMTEAERRFRPHRVSYQGAEMIVVVRDRELSGLMLEGASAEAFRVRAQALTSGLENPLIVTGSDGENGAWYRNTNPHQNFWGGFYREILEDARAGGAVRPCYIHDYLKAHGTLGEVEVATGAWNTEWHDGKDFGQWAGLPAQSRTLARIRGVSQALHRTRAEGASREIGVQEQASLAEALEQLLRAETSCNFYWGESWVERAQADLDAAEATLNRCRAKKYLMDTDVGWLLPEIRGTVNPER